MCYVYVNDTVEYGAREETSGDFFSYIKKNPTYFKQKMGARALASFLYSLEDDFWLPDQVIWLKYLDILT